LELREKFPGFSSDLVSSLNKFGEKKNPQKSSQISNLFFVTDCKLIFKKIICYGSPKINSIFNIETNSVHIHIESSLIQANINLDK